MANGDEYMGLPVALTDDQARECFRQRFHCEPKEVKRTGGGLLVGPKPKPAYTEPDWLEDFVPTSRRGGRRVA